ncbi:orotate phosphoribosyltransferase [Tenuifilum thalassicum]|uniref:Orotate phosphoribosyltransferase n=1 Tax=Tenuifilum thalassicum TaxID=2590900 RepID=A0A7D4BYL3_9BACT|nr:orotate phosphoribosyltransferase [Tenuifilum thalassicum]QKG79204.1 orotate phosphoribosyltransferase [Tenuifilum thalassicum]
MDSNIIADKLLQINAIKLNPANPFTWASGWKSPIYCDNRKTLSYPDVRNVICDGFVSLIKEKYPQAEVIAGVATGAIAHGMLVADRLDLPFIYVRSVPKSHGLTNQIEGHFTPGQKVVVIEDLISTGMSSLAAVEALRNAGCDVLGLLAIFTYQFDKAKNAFADANVDYETLSNYSLLIDAALSKGVIGSQDIELLKSWRTNPEEWGK